MLWLIDLHQRFELPYEIRASTQIEINDFGEETDAAVKRLLQIANAPASASGQRTQSIAPDGAVVFLKARQRNLPFFVASKYSQNRETASIISEIVTGEAMSNADQWELRKSGSIIDPQSYEKLKAKIIVLAESPQEFITLKAIDEQFNEQWNNLIKRVIDGWKANLKLKAEKQAKHLLLAIYIGFVSLILVIASLTYNYVRKEWGTFFESLQGVIYFWGAVIGILSIIFLQTVLDPWKYGKLLH
jgi:hypothetical protein